MSQSRHRGITIREVGVIVVCIAAIIIVLLVVLRTNRLQSLRVQDATQMSMIHKSWLTFAQNSGGQMPTPGLIDRLPDPLLGETPGRGAEDESQNTTANLFSLCIAQNYLPSAEICVSPLEPSSHVVVMTSDTYNWNAFKPTMNPPTYWDTNFKADLNKVSNVSYAHQPLIGRPKLAHWRYTQDSKRPILGTRGPLNGIADPKSVTNKFFPPNDSWNGQFVYGDNHVEFTSSFFGGLATTSTMPSARDNFFAWDSLDFSDVMITFTKAIKDGKPVVEHD